MTDHKRIRAYDPEEPNVHLVRRDGWMVGTTVGRYCVAWRGREEVVFVWRDGEWHAVSGAYRKAG